MMELSDLDLVVLMSLAVMGVCAIWAIAVAVLWMVDGIAGWLHRRGARSFDKLRMKRPWR